MAWRQATRRQSRVSRKNDNVGRVDELAAKKVKDKSLKGRFDGILQRSSGDDPGVH